MAYEDRWRPQPDHDRPYNPYYPGFTTKIEPHTPPIPFGRPDYRHRPCPQPTPPRKWRRGVTQAQMLLHYPPLETKHQPNFPWNPANRISTSSLLVTKSVAIGNSRRAQLVTCTISPEDGAPFQAMAKIYDGLYSTYYPFEHINGLMGKIPQNLSRETDGNYSREAAVYEHLTKVGMIGGFAPDYYGSWTMYLPIRASLGPGEEVKEHIRPVRLILMEIIDGPNMKSVFLRNRSYDAMETNAFHLPEAYRLDIMARILDGQVRQFHSGIIIRELCRGDIVITPDPNLSNPPPRATRVVVLDYSMTTLFELSERGPMYLHDRPLPPNPWDRWCECRLDEFFGWAPESWHNWQDEEEMLQGIKQRLDWLEASFGGDNKREYEPLEDSWTFEKEMEKRREREEEWEREREEIEEEERQQREEREQKERQAEEEAKEREEENWEGTPIHITIEG